MRIAGRLAALVTALSLTACMSPENPPTTTPTTHTAKSDAVLRVVQNVMAAEHLKSAIVRVTSRREGGGDLGVR